MEDLLLLLLGAAVQSDQKQVRDLYSTVHLYSTVRLYTTLPNICIPGLHHRHQEPAPRDPARHRGQDQAGHGQPVHGLDQGPQQSGQHERDGQGRDVRGTGTAYQQVGPDFLFIKDR